MEKAPWQRQIGRLAALEEPTRRALYCFVVDHRGEVSRDQAARALGVSRNLAGFHLDRLAEEGLLEISYRRLTGRSGPGAGRPSKLYYRSERQIQISLPQRSYGLAARILATAMDAGYTPELDDILDATARRVGWGIGHQAKASIRPEATRTALLEATITTLGEHGFEPTQEEEKLRLRNCPFYALVKQNKALVCGMNLSLIEGLVGGVGLTNACPVFEPQEGHCCVCLKLSSS